MSRSDITFLHLRCFDQRTGNMSSYGGATIAMQEDQGGVTYAIAQCHENDRFVKQVGRAKSQGRLLSKNEYDRRFVKRLADVSVEQLTTKLCQGVSRRSLLKIKT
jgi:hypothetical protein